MTKAILRKDWFEEVFWKWKTNPSEVEKTRGTHPFGGGYTEIFTGQHPEVMRNHSRFLEYIDKYKLKINMSIFPLQREGFINISLKNEDIFNIDKYFKGDKPFLVLIEDLFESISFNMIGKFITKIYDSMELNGEIIIKTPNLEEIIKRYAEKNMNYVDLIKILYGNQIDSIDYKACIYDSQAIKILLDDVGFVNIHIEKIENGLFLYITGRKDRELN